MIFEIKDGVVQDMYECSVFKMQVQYLKKNERIVLKMRLNDWQVTAALYAVWKGAYAMSIRNWLIPQKQQRQEIYGNWRLMGSLKIKVQKAQVQNMNWNNKLAHSWLKEAIVVKLKLRILKKRYGKKNTQP